LMFTQDYQWTNTNSNTIKFEMDLLRGIMENDRLAILSSGFLFVFA